MTPTYCAECGRITPCPHSSTTGEDVRTDGGHSVEIVSTDPLATLSPAQRDAFVAVDVHGQGVRSFARQTDRSSGTVGNLLSRAREIFRPPVCMHCGGAVAVTTSACDLCGGHPFIAAQEGDHV